MARNPYTPVVWPSDRGWRRSWWPKATPILDEGGVYYADILTQIRQRGRFDCDDSDMPPADSEDSYNYFARHNALSVLTWEELEERDRQSVARYNARISRRQAKLQERWEAERRERQQAKERRADEEWQAEEDRRHREAAARQTQQTIATIVRARHYWGWVWRPFAVAPMVVITLAQDYIWRGKIGFEANHRYCVPQSVADEALAAVGGTQSPYEG